MPLNLYLFGERKDGYTKTTREAGFSGIAVITWAEESRAKMKGRSSAGKRYRDT